MSENTENVGITRPRRGLPRRPGENEADANGGLGNEKLSSNLDSAPSPAEVDPARRRGLPRPGEPRGEASAATSAPTGRRSGLPRPNASTTPTAVAQPNSATARRQGLPTAISNDNEPRTASPTPAHPSTSRSGLTVKTDPATSTSGTTQAVEKNPRQTPALWLKIVIGVVGLFIIAGLFVLLARWLRTLEPVQSFLIAYPGESHLPVSTPVGFPAWLGWQHFLNAFFIVLIIRTGWQVRTQQRPPATWTRNNEGLFKTKNPPKKISLTLWAHLTLDVLWFLNGIVFVALLFATGHWARVVPTSWDVFPNALSALLQYMSMDWPTENGWVNYNGLQLLAYFTTIFIAAPLAAITGLRMSGIWPANAEKLNKVYPMELARAIHFPVMLYFTLFVIMHVFLVFATGALRNLNHMYAAQDTTTWTGFWIFFVSLLVMAGAVFAARPLVLAPIAQLMGKVGR